MNEGTTSFDVVIVGAGFAGVAAGRDVTRRGHSALILEGRDRIGGRTLRRDSSLGRPLEFGGAYVHWTQPHVFSEITAYGLTLDPSPFPQKAIWLVDGERVTGTPEDLGPLTAPFAQVLEEEARWAFPNPYEPFPPTEGALALDQLSLTDRLQSLELSDAQSAVIRAQWALSFSGPISEGSYLSALRLMALTGTDAQFGEANYGWSVKEGTSVLIEAMQADSKAQLRLSTGVTAIEQDGDVVRVTTDAGDSVIAKHVIVTVPLNALDAIRFSPELSSEKRAVADGGQISRGIKVWIRARGKIDSFIAWAPEDYPLNMLCSEYEIDGDSILLAFGNDADALDVSDPEAVQAAVKVWRDDLEVVAVDAEDWTHDQFSKGTWAILGVGHATQRLEELQRADGRVRLAGSDYATGWNGYIDGALLSGRRAALDVSTELEAGK